MENSQDELFYNLLEKKRFSDAKKIILELSAELNKSDPQLNYFWALYYDDSDNPDCDKHKAKENFSKLYDSGKANVYTFIRLKDLSDNKNQKISILKKGLEKYPNDESLYWHLIKETDLQDRYKLFEEILIKEIDSTAIELLKVETYLYNNDHEKLLEILPKIRKDVKEDIDFNSLLEGVSLFELGEYKRAKLLFDNLIENDIRYQLELAPYYCSILCSFNLNNEKNAIKLFEAIPLDKEFDSFIYSSVYRIYFEYKKYLLDSLTSLEKNSRDINILSKIRLFRAFLFYRSEYEIKFKDALYAFKVYTHNYELCQMLIEHSCRNKKFLDAYKYFMSWINSTSSRSFNFEEDFYQDWDFIKHANDSEFQLIIDLFKNTLKDEQFYHSSEVSQTILNPIVKRLFDEKKYVVIVELSKLFSEIHLERSGLLFEIAYSYTEIDNPHKGENLYNRCLKKDGESSAVFNNLGVIYENRKEYEKAKDYFNNALKLDPENQLYRNNFARIKQKIEKKWENEIRNVAKEIKVLNLEKIGYNKNLIFALNKSTSVELRDMVERDLRENAIALCAKCYKTSLVLSGSIIESILLDKILSKGLKKYKIENGRTKKISEMNLNELLYVAFKENIISNQLYHLAHGIKDFRNVIHPGVEQRKKALSINSENASLAWAIVKKAIMEI